MLYLFYLLGSILFLLGYFRIADHFNVVDKPNHRSSHTQVTILGGGIIFPIAILMYSATNNFSYPYFVAGILLISVISFIDDIRPVNFIFRLLCQLAAVSLMFFDAELMSQPFWIVLVGYIIVIGTINAYNFMDGINGLTAAYSLITVISLWYLNEFMIPFVPTGWLVIPALALAAFSLFNFRKVARCFAGDVGSVSMAFILLFFILSLIVHTGELKFIGLLLIYGLDSVSTIIFRIIRRENIFAAHRSHFYQHLSNIKGWSHLTISLLYAFLQLIANVFLFSTSFHSETLLILLILFGLITITLRLYIEGKEFLLKAKVEL